MFINLPHRLLIKVVGQSERVFIKFNFFCFSKLLPNAGMEFSLYVFLFTLFIAHLQVETQGTEYNDISPTTFASKDTKTFRVYNSNGQCYNKFGRFNSWTCNTPQMTNFETALLVIKPSMTIQTYRYRILVFGEISKRKFGDASLGDANSYQTWIYYEETDSWKMIASVTNGPTWMHRIHLVTFCSSRAIILSPDAINSTWIFMFEQLKWKRVAIVGNGPSWTNINSDIFAVAVESDRSLCSCSQDVFVFYPNEDRNQIVSYRLICMEEQTTYLWEKVGNYTIPFVRSLRLVGGWSGQTTVFAVVDECIWTYSVMKSIWNKTNLCFQYGTFRIVLNAVYSDFLFVNDTNEIIYISIDRRLVRKLSVSNGFALEEKISENSFQYSFLNFGRPASYVLRFDRQGIRYYLPWYNGRCGFSVMRVKIRNVSGELMWQVTRINNRRKIPSDYLVQSLWRDTYYRIAFPSNDVRSKPPVMWSMNLLSTQRWQMEGSLNVTGISISKNMRMSSIVSMHMQENVWLVVSSKHTVLIESRDHIQLMSSPRPSRNDFTVVTINSTSALLFGGYSGNKYKFNVFNDLWHFSLTRRIWNKVHIIESRESGSVVNTNKSTESVPSPRYNHAAAVIEFEMFVFGGYDIKDNLKLELWKYNMINNSWRYLKPTNNISYFASDEQHCYFSATAQSEMLWIASKCPLHIWDDHFEVNFYLWMFIVQLQTWDFVAFDKLENMPHKYFYSSLDFWRGYLQILQPYGLVYIKAGCPVGLGSSNISRFPCDVCKVGCYSDVETKECRKCPNGTTTREERSSRLTDCNLCVTGYCRHGRCLVGLMLVPVCSCTFGFTGSRCQDATYYYIGTGFILVIGIITLLVVVLRRITKKRRERETAFRRHIQTLNDAWQISWQEIELQDEIGGGASGRVWKAQYRNIDVAVKMLIGNDESQPSLEFTAEIKFMQTMRHRNIVLFIGAGKTSPQEQPFLVVEFAHRGSLRHVLDDVSIKIDQNRKIDFSLDVSKGMEFLHKLDPPRIHRDLKSENLLVCKSWIVKVADFGLGRLFGKAQKNRRSKQNNSLSSNNSESEILVEMRDLSQDGIGTVRWSAPELARRESYDGSIDVYRYSTTSFLLYLILI